MRRRAEELAGATESAFADNDARRLLHELEVHQIELEIQNTELRAARDEAEAALDRYTELYDFAPVGYCTLTPRGIISRANLTISAMVGIDRDKMPRRSFGMLLARSDRAAFKSLLYQVLTTETVRSGEFKMADPKLAVRFVSIEAKRYFSEAESSAVIQCNIRDIGTRKLAEDMASRNVKLNREIARRKTVEEDLRAHRKEQTRLLKQSSLQQKQLRDLSHQILNAQEEERKRISRELHDIIAQTLVGINVHLEVLDQGNAESSDDFRKQISKTQVLVERAVKIVHDFARELRPTMLDDLGLIPALQMYMKQFMADTGIRVSLKAYARVDHSVTMVRTVLYRIAQEALSNAARHAKASRVDVRIEPEGGMILMTIKDNGKGFKTGGVGKRSNKKNRLGLIGMKERAEMIGGSFEVITATGGPTTVRVAIPMA